ncbi:hypothetical protein HJC23_001157 [Cyclotella cryptica]|uniref:Uncharacterized protein n=1 Tax=Cyclotella cryptica TaxID=29204 RepID=A0ABD3P501_9STRA
MGNRLLGLGRTLYSTVFNTRSKLWRNVSVEKSKRLYKSGEEARSLMNSLESDTCGIIQWIGYFCLFQTCEAFALLRFGDPNIAGNMLLPYDNTSNNHHLGIGDIKGALSREQKVAHAFENGFSLKVPNCSKRSTIRCGMRSLLISMTSRNSNTDDCTGE